jgi:hypothetical protein
MRHRVTPFAIAFVVFVVLSACQERGVGTLRVSVERTSDDVWRAEFHLPRPAEVLRFPHNTNTFREGQWRVLTPGLALGLEDGFETVRDTSGARFDTVVFEFDNVSKPLEKDYELLLRFTDGGALIYTGHFWAVVLPEEREPLPIEMTFTPRFGEHLILDGQTFAASVIRTYPDPGFATYVYFGSAEPTETDEILAIVDPGLPAWIQETTRAFFPLCSRTMPRARRFPCPRNRWSSSRTTPVDRIRTATVEALFPGRSPSCP